MDRYFHPESPIRSKKFGHLVFLEFCVYVLKNALIHTLQVRPSLRGKNIWNIYVVNNVILRITEVKMLN